MLKYLIIGLFILPGYLKGQEIRHEAFLSKDTLFKTLAVLASDSFEGRETGFKGQKLAADYILSQFKSVGLRPGKDTAFFQSYQLKVKAQSGSSLSIGSKSATFGKDYFFFPGFSDISLDESILFSYCPKGKDGMHEKVVVIGPGHADTVKSMIKNASEAGAVAAFVLLDDFKNISTRNEHRMKKSSVWLEGTRPSEGFPVIFIDSGYWNSCLSKADKATSRMVCSKNGKDCIHEINLNTGLSIQREVKTLTGENVIAFIKGTVDETIVFSAHYDHLGVVDGEIYNGADDNASGTSGIIAICKSLGKTLQEEAQGRNLLFIAFSGEEKGLLGSSYYVKNPFIPLEKTYANVNIDMIGRRDKVHENSKPYVYVIGAGRISKDLQELTEEANKKAGLELDYTYDDPKDPNRFYYRSDHYNFAKYGVPVVFFFNGVHPDYHKSTDTMEKIVPELLEERVKLTWYLGYLLMKRDQELRKNQSE